METCTKCPPIRSLQDGEWFKKKKERESERGRNRGAEVQEKATQREKSDRNKERSWPNARNLSYVHRFLSHLSDNKKNKAADTQTERQRGSGGEKREGEDDRNKLPQECNHLSIATTSTMQPPALLPKLLTYEVVQLY